MHEGDTSAASRMKQFSKIGIALSSERNLPKLLEMIVDGAREMTGADGGTLYIVSEDQRQLRFSIVENESLKIRMGGLSEDVTWPPIPLVNEDGSANKTNVSAYCALTGETLNLDDVYTASGFDFDGTKQFDKKTGYRSRSMLVVPMRDHENEMIGVLQLLNAGTLEVGEIVSFSDEAEEIAEALAAQAAISITNTRLMHDLERLFDAFIRSIALAIDEKSPYTGGHIRRVAELTLRIAQKINETSDGLFADTGFNADQLKEIRLAGWLHDIGKITTPEFVVDKSTKLSTISDGIVTVKTRLELLKRDAEIAFLKEWIGHCLEEGHTEKPDALEGQFQERCRQLDEDGAFLNEINYGGEYLAEDKIDRIGRIARNRWFLNGEEQPLLSEQEVTNLAIRRGTLNNEERKKIENHAAVTLTMLSALPFPKKIKNVPSIAASHHERIDGRGYPRGLSGDQLPLQARIIALADVFEALTAKRPYKSAKKISEVMRIMAMMVKDNHLDRDLFRFFIEEKLFLAYAEENLATDQQDEVDFDFLLDQQ